MVLLTVGDDAHIVPFFPFRRERHPRRPDSSPSRKRKHKTRRAAARLVRLSKNHVIPSQCAHRRGNPPEFSTLFLH